MLIPLVIAAPTSFFFLRFVKRLDLAEESLRASEERYRSILEAAPDSITITRVEDGRYLEVNRAFCELSGYAREEALGKTPADLNLFVNLEDRKRLIDTLKEKGKVTGFDIQYRMRDGRIHDTILSAKLLLYGEENCLITIVSVITERKQAEEALRESEERYRLLAENVEDIIWIRGMDLKIKYISPSVKRITGFSVAEAMESGLEGFFSPASVELAKSVFADELATRKNGKKNPPRTCTLQLDGRRKDGIKIWTEEKVSLLRDSDEKPVGILGVTRDITERKQAEIALQQSEERYRSLVENTSYGYFICEIISGRFLFLNRRSCNLFGHTLREGLGLSIWNVISYGENEDVLSRIQKQLEGTESESVPQVYTAVRKDGVTFRAEIATSMVIYQGKPCIHGVVRDISEQERLHKQIERVQRMEAIGTLAGGIAHDFNNLLMGIQGNASILLNDKSFSGAYRERVTKIEQYVSDAKNLTSQLLGAARGGKYQVRPTDLNQTIQKTCEMFRRTRKDIKIRTAYQEDIWTVEGDQGQMEQVLLNLFLNACQAMPGGGDLYIQTENVALGEEIAPSFNARPGDYVKIFVADTGVGMDETTQKRIFDPFFTTKEMGRGTGLGLASAYGIIKNHHGIIDVWSEVGKGTIFFIYLPASQKKAGREENMAETQVLRGSETILIVDDEERILEIGADMLKGLGYEVLSAMGGREGIEIYKEKWRKIDLVILDMVMPDISGGEAYDQLKEINPDIKVLLITGYSMEGKAQEILARGCDGFIQKPFNINALSQKIRETIGTG